MHALDGFCLQSLYAAQDNASMSMAAWLQPNLVSYCHQYRTDSHCSCRAAYYEAVCRQEQ